MMYLQDVTCKLHEEGYGFDIIFEFEKNDYFTNSNDNPISKYISSRISFYLYN